MSELKHPEPLAEMTAHGPFWSALLPSDEATPTIETKARWLSRFLGSWASNVEDGIAEIPASPTPGIVDEDENQEVAFLLASLSHGADALLAFKKRDRPVDIPPQFTAVANLIFVRAESRGLTAHDRTVHDVALRLAAAKTYATGSPRPITVDDQGRVFDLSGERLFQFNPEKMLRSRRQIEAGETRSLDELRAAEVRDGR